MRKKTLLGVYLSLVLGLSASCVADTARSLTPIASSGSSGPSTADKVPVFTYKVINRFPHDPRAFTQGLAVENGVLFEGTGLRGRSTLRTVNLQSGKIEKLRKLPAYVFGEGITLFGNWIIQCTWKSNVIFVYDKQSLRLMKTVDYPRDSWGITYDGKHLFMSDGTSTLRLLDPQSFQETGRLKVHDNDGSVSRLNELEYVQGEIFANIWKTDRIARISPRSGKVVGWVDLTGLLGPQDHGGSVDVLNGIAYDAENDRLFVTGKLWPRLFEIELIRQE